MSNSQGLGICGQRKYGKREHRRAEKVRSVGKIPLRFGEENTSDWTRWEKKGNTGCRGGTHIYDHQKKQNKRIQVRPGAPQRAGSQMPVWGVKQNLPITVRRQSKIMGRKLVSSKESTCTPEDANGALRLRKKGVVCSLVRTKIKGTCLMRRRKKKEREIAPRQRLQTSPWGPPRT